MIRAGAPKRFWDHAIEFEAYVRSHTAHDIYLLGGEVPETIMFGKTSDISQFCELGWYDWVMFHDGLIAFPDVQPVLGRYLAHQLILGRQ